MGSLEMFLLTVFKEHAVGRAPAVSLGSAQTVPPGAPSQVPQPDSRSLRSQAKYPSERSN